MGEQIIHFAGLKFRAPSRAFLLDKFDKFKIVVTVNADFIVTAHRDSRFKEIINENYATFDGQVPYWLAKLVSYRAKAEIEKVSGSDLIIDLLRRAESDGRRVFLLGASADSNAKAVEIARERFGVEVDGWSPSFCNFPFPSSLNDDILERIRVFRPDFLFVAFGAPKQEYWLAQNALELENMGVKVCVGCGGSIDFLSGKMRRAPLFIQKAGLEGLYRLVMEPKMFRLKRLMRSLLIFKYVLK